MTCPSASPHLIPRLFPDDCLIYKEIWSQVDADELQEDLDALQEWEQQWMMSFHPQKCQLLRITRKKSPVRASYVIHGHTLAETDTAKYLGVSLYEYLFWSPHVNATAKKVNGTRAFLQRNLSKAPTAVKTRTYESLIRPIIEYSSLAQDVNKLERWSNTGTPATHPGTMVESAASLPSWKLPAWNP